MTERNDLELQAEEMPEQKAQRENTEENKEETLDELLARINNRDSGAQDHKDFTVESDINKADYRYFFYHSALLKNKGILALYLALPAGLALVFACIEGEFVLNAFIFMAVILYLFMALIQVFRTERKLAQIKKNSPLTLHTTTTRFTFDWNYILHTKNDETLKIKYDTLAQVCKTKKRVILYFRSNKAMVIHNSDVEQVMPLDDFVKFLNSKIKK